MSQAMRDAYKALYIKKEFEKNAIVELAKIDEDSSAVFYCAVSFNGKSMYFEITEKHGAITDIYSAGATNTLIRKNDDETISIITDLSQLNIVSDNEDAEGKVSIEQKSEVHFGKLLSVLSATELADGEKVKPHPAGGVHTQSGDLYLSFENNIVTTETPVEDNGFFVGLDIRQYVHHVIEKDYLYDGTYEQKE